MNRELLARVRDRIAEVGNEHCDMTTYFNGSPTSDGEPECGTTACIAGWALVAHHGSRQAFYESIDPETYTGEAARLLLDLPEAIENVGDSALFHLIFWPAHYQELADEEGDAKGMLSLLDAILDGRVVFNDDGELVDLEAQLVEEVEALQ